MIVGVRPISCGVDIDLLLMNLSKPYNILSMPDKAIKSGRSQPFPNPWSDSGDPIPNQVLMDSFKLCPDTRIGPRRSHLRSRSRYNTSPISGPRTEPICNYVNYDGLGFLEYVGLVLAHITIRPETHSPNPAKWGRRMGFLLFFQSGSGWICGPIKLSRILALRCEHPDPT